MELVMLVGYRLLRHADHAARRGWFHAHGNAGNWPEWAKLVVGVITILTIVWMATHWNSPPRS